MKYLAIKNWDKYQSLSRSGKWIKDYTDQAGEDEELSKLSLFERGLLQEIRRMRGKLGRNIPNDVPYMASAMHALSTDRPRIRYALSTLLERGFLILTDQQDDSSNSRENKKENKNEKKIKPSRTASQASDSRFMPFVDVLHRYQTKFAPQQRFDVWFGNRGGKQLKNLLKAEPELDLATFERSVGARARSPGVDHSRPVFEWITHVIGGPKVTNGQTRSVGKSDAREQRIIADLIADCTAGEVDSADAGALALPGNGQSRTGGLARNPELIPPERSAEGARPSHAAAAKAGAG